MNDHTGLDAPSPWIRRFSCRVGPGGAVLGFGRGWGVVGLWVGLSIGLVLIGTVLVTVWTRRIRAFSMP